MYIRCSRFDIQWDGIKKHPTTIRLTQELYEAVKRQADEDVFTFSEVVQLLLRAYSKGRIRLGVMHDPISPAEEKAAEGWREFRKGWKEEQHSGWRAVMREREKEKKARLKENAGR